MNQPSKARIIGVIFLSWFSTIGFDFFLHSGLIASLYSKPNTFLLSPEKAFQLIPLGYLAILIFVSFLFSIMRRINILGWKSGLIFGLQMGAFVSGPMALGFLSITTTDIGLMAAWIIGQTVGSGIAGSVAGAGMATKRPWRLAMYVFLSIVATFMITVILQSWV